MNHGLTLGTILLVAAACATPPPCEANESSSDACSAITAALQSRCSSGASVNCPAILSSCAANGGTPDLSQRVCTNEVSLCATAVAAAPDCATAQAIATSASSCPLTCYLP